MQTAFDRHAWTRRSARVFVPVLNCVHSMQPDCVKDEFKEDMLRHVIEWLTHSFGSTTAGPHATAPQSGLTTTLESRVTCSEGIVASVTLAAKSSQCPVDAHSRLLCICVKSGNRSSCAYALDTQQCDVVWITKYSIAGVCASIAPARMTACVQPLG